MSGIHRCRPFVARPPGRARIHRSRYRESQVKCNRNLIYRRPACQPGATCWQGTTSISYNPPIACSFPGGRADTATGPVKAGAFLVRRRYTSISPPALPRRTAAAPQSRRSPRRCLRGIPRTDPPRGQNTCLRPPPACIPHRWYSRRRSGRRPPARRSCLRLRAKERRQREG